MVPKVILILNFKMNIVTKFQVFIIKNDEVRGGGGKETLDWRQRGIGLSEVFFKKPVNI